VFEDFDGGYVWELGLTFSPSYRPKTWILKRAYESEEIEKKESQPCDESSKLRT
jgi:hypothetical protein